MSFINANDKQKFGSERSLARVLFPACTPDGEDVAIIGNFTQLSFLFFLSLRGEDVQSMYW